MITKNEEHHDCAGVDDNLHGGHKFRALQKVKPCERDHDHDQRKRAVNRVPLQDQAQRSGYGDRGEDQENRHLRRDHRIPRRVPRAICLDSDLIVASAQSRDS
jgi:hypothetical protein